MTSRRARPLGVTLCAAYAGLNAFIWLPQGLVPMIVAGAREATSLGVIVLLAAGYGGFAALTAHGLWTLRPWGRFAAWWLAGSSIPFGLMSLAGAPPYPPATTANTWLQLFFLACDVATLLYLARAKVQALFTAPPDAGAAA